MLEGVCFLFCAHRDFAVKAVMLGVHSVVKLYGQTFATG